jgi:hypothetical protein
MFGRMLSTLIETTHSRLMIAAIAPGAAHRVA